MNRGITSGRSIHRFSICISDSLRMDSESAVRPCENGPANDINEPLRNESQRDPLPEPPGGPVAANEVRSAGFLHFAIENIGGAIPSDGCFHFLLTISRKGVIGIFRANAGSGRQARQPSFALLRASSP